MGRVLPGPRRPDGCLGPDVYCGPCWQPMAGSAHAMDGCATVAFPEGAGMTGLARIALLARIFRPLGQTVRAAWAGMWSNPGCESLFHPYVGVMFMPAGGGNHVRHRGGRQLRCRRIRQTFQEMGYSKP